MGRQIGRVLIGAALLLFAAACGPAGGPSGVLDPEPARGLGRTRPDAGPWDGGADCIAAELSAIRDLVFVPRCATGACHSSADSAASLALDLDPAALAERLRAPSTQSPSGMPLVTPGQPGASWLFLKIGLEVPLVGDPMPPAEALSACDLEAIRAWIVSL